MATSKKKADDKSHLKMADPNGAPWQAGTAEEWHNLIAQGYKAVGAGPQGSDESSVAGSEPAKLDNKPATGGPTAN